MSRGRAPLLIGVLAVLWGSNFLWIKISLDGLSPLQVTFGRLASGALVLGALVHGRAEAVPRDRPFLAHLAVAGLLANAVPYLLFAVGEQRIDSSLAGVINATTPLWTLLVAVLARQETRPGPSRLAGLGLGFAGAVVIFQPWRTIGGSSLGGEIACLAAAATLGLSFVYSARYLIPRPVSPFVLAYGQTLAATILLVPALVVAGRQATGLDASVWGAMVALGPIGTGAAYVLNFAIIAREGATVASTVTYLLPIIAVSLGAAVLDEPITAAVVAGTAIVLVGVALTRRHTPNQTWARNEPPP